MGEVSETMTKRKKKGRPSLLDLQKRSLKKQQQQQQQRQHHHLNSTNSLYSNANKNGVVEDDDDERKEKKHKLLVGLNSHLHHHRAALSPSNSAPHGDPDAARKRRKIDASLHGSDEIVSASHSISSIIDVLTHSSQFPLSLFSLIRFFWWGFLPMPLTIGKPKFIPFGISRVLCPFFLFS